MKDTLDKLKQMLNDTMPGIDTSNITEESNLSTDLGLDSLNMMLLAISVEEMFDISIDEDFVPSTVGNLCQYIEDKSAKQ